MNKEDGAVYYVPAIRSFQDTGFVAHGFSNGSKIMAKVERSGDSAGFCIRLIVIGEGGEEMCDFTMDRLSALCIIDVLNKNIMNQEELLYTKDEGEDNDNRPAN